MSDQFSMARTECFLVTTYLISKWLAQTVSAQSRYMYMYTVIDWRVIMLATRGSVETFEILQKDTVAPVFTLRGKECYSTAICIHVTFLDLQS